VVSNIMWHVTSVWIYLTTVIPSRPLTCQKTEEIDCNKNEESNII
jgi:hypothetical protein